MKPHADVDTSGNEFAIALGAGDWRRAAALIEAARSQGAWSAPWALRETDWYMAQQRWDEATTLLKDLLSRQPESESYELAVRHNLASAALAQRDAAAAVAWLSPFLEKQGVAGNLPAGFEATRVLWVRSLHQWGDLPRLMRSVLQLEAAGQLGPVLAGTASLAAWDMGDMEAARRWCEMASTALPPEARPLESLATEALLMLSEGHGEEARTIARDMAIRWPREARAFIVLGFAELSLGDAGTAARTFEAAASVDRRAAQAWRGLGWARLLLRDAEGARRSLLTARSLDASHAETHAGLALVLAMQSRKAEAEQSLAESQRLAPANASARHAESVLAGQPGTPLEIGSLVASLMGTGGAGDARVPRTGPGKRQTRQEAVSRGNVAPRPPAVRRYKIAVVTPTFNRPELLVQTLRYFLAQDVVDSDNLHWFVLDDSPVPGSLASLQDPRIHYRCLPSKISLGSKRNQLNAMAKAWGADFICSMDDDDWYGPQYVSSMVDLLVAKEDCLFAGSSQDYYYHVASGKVLRVGASGPGHSCNGVLCYRVAALEGRKYDEGRNFGEEPSFLRGAFVAQHPDIQRVHLALAHAQNTVDKDPIYLAPACHTDLELSRFPMRTEDRLFYLSLTERRNEEARAREPFVA
ncbi:glycosyltransferase [Variovorax arabinosiphilus]|uniref:glycosyltransferase n=1 Tax=Variovorax arabinosiphilus TaxID=3053498 RepID=UPI0025781F37|nr:MULTISPECIES: glycosyltransferase [unclassified Variovorax]MDM0122206.1 glycosyltransferase [Variovorax sp. J2L1-78]MDM0131265.1 glycosyltransferase [Variovorax sp. J2L1-63]MDM0234969.1 glycosyltransferase [Variovorax sp. J2R1-6]